jgi:mRNA-degrading endonuclease RelE of RelBE toxin-antitoxin system
MKRRIQVRGQVKEFLERLAPEPRRRIKLAIRALGDDSGARLALKEQLAGYHRLRVGGYCVIFRYLPGQIIECVFAEERSLVYQIFEREMLERLRHEDRGESSERGQILEEAPAKYKVSRRRVRRTKKPVS